MKFKKLIPYIAIFLIAFFATPLIGNWFIKHANQQAEKYIKNFRAASSSLSEGNYQGKFKVFNFITLSHVQFSIQNGKVENLAFKKMFRTPGYLSKNEIELKVNNSNHLELDAFSGATRTSNFAKAAIKAAIENKNIK